MKKKIFIIICLLLVGCHRNPINRLVNPMSDGVVPNSSGTFMIYDDELKTGGGVGFIPGGDNQLIVFNDHSSSRSRSQIRYQWNGGDTIASSNTHAFAGFVLLNKVDSVSNDAAPGKNLSAPGYTSLKLSVRGTLSDNTKLRIEGPDDGNSLTPTSQIELDSSQLTSSWQDITLVVPPGEFSSVKTYITISFQYTVPPRTTNTGQGGTVYLDDVRYEK